MRATQKTRLLICVLILLASVLVSVPVAAQTPTSGLSITPVITELTLNPGESKSLTLTIKDITSGSVIAQGSVSDFEADDFSGNPKIIVDPNVQSPNSIRRFVTGLTDTRLDTGQQKNLNLVIKAPDNITPGAYFGVLRFKAVPATQAAPNPNEVSLSASVGSIVLITVPGNIKEQAQLKAIHVYRDGKAGSFFLGAPTQVGLEIHNLGQTFIKPFGTVQIKDMTGRVVYSYQISDPKQKPNILPDSSRTLTENIKNINKPGRYTVSASVAYGSGSNVLTMQKSFWYIPKWVAYVILGLMAVVIVLIYWLRRHRHHAKHR